MRRLISLLLVIVIICGHVCSCADKNSPDYRYDRAVKLMNSGKYAEAVTEFDSLNGYKDSADLSRKANARSLNTGKVKAGDIITNKDGDHEVTLLENGHVMTKEGEKSLLMWLKDITGWQSVHTYKFAVHKETGKTLSELRKEYLQENLDEE